jgi:hypothetical protein
MAHVGGYRRDAAHQQPAAARQDGGDLQGSSSRVLYAIKALDRDGRLPDEA